MPRHRLEHHIGERHRAPTGRRLRWRQVGRTTGQEHELAVHGQRAPQEVEPARGDAEGLALPRGMSFAFAVAEGDDTWHEERGKLPLRLIHTITHLPELTVCTFPAYPTTTVTTDAGARTPMAMRRRLLEDRMAATGGSVTPGRRVAPPAALREWLTKYRVRVGTRPAAA